MIAMLKGTVVEKGNGEAVLMTAAGIGFSVQCSMNTLSRLPSGGTECTLLTVMNVREDAVDLFGFAAAEERDMFRSLISVSGIGPKTALGVLGSMSLSDLRLAILTGDAAALSRAPGIGKKTAQRIALELKDKIAQDAMTMSPDSTEASLASGGGDNAQDAVNEAMLALKSLGYSPQEAANALKSIKGQADTPDELIRLALRHMAKNG